jgi:4-hydroxy-tetrahydrodipicolinate synthase
MTAAPAIHGIIAYPITPFGRDGGVDTATLSALLEKLIGAGVHAIAPLGSTGEAAYLTEDEFNSVVDTTVNTVGHRVPVIVGASDLTTANTIRRARYAQHTGADAVMILPVSYWKLSTREIAQHYATVAAALDIPIMAYNNPATSGIDMSPELLVQMFTEIDNLTMVKESTGDLNRMLRIKELTGNTLPFYNGSNPDLDALTAGASDCTAAPNLRPAPASTSTRRPGGDYDAAKSSTKTFAAAAVHRCRRAAPRSRRASISSAPTSKSRPPLLPLDEAGLDEMRSLLIDWPVTPAGAQGA